MQKVIVIGSPGAGKSTFARQLRAVTNLPLYYLDMIWHKSDGTNISLAEFDKQLDKILQSDRWIIDGNYQRTLAMRLCVCDTVFLLDYSLRVCLEGAESRIGKSVRTCRGWKQNLMKRLNSGSLTFLKNNFLIFIGCWRNIKKIKPSLFSKREKKLTII